MEISDEAHSSLEITILSKGRTRERHFTTWCDLSLRDINSYALFLDIKLQVVKISLILARRNHLNITL